MMRGSSRKLRVPGRESWVLGCEGRAFPMAALRTTHNPEPTTQNSLTPQRDRRVHLRCAAARDPARRGRDDEEQRGYSAEGQWITHAHAVELAGEPSRDTPRHR